MTAEVPNAEFEITVAAPHLLLRPASMPSPNIISEAANTSCNRDIDEFIGLSRNELHGASGSDENFEPSNRHSVFKRRPSLATANSPRKSTTTTHSYNLHAKQDIDGLFNGIERRNSVRLLGR